MEINKYFIPDITDLRVGYACEHTSAGNFLNGEIIVDKLTELDVARYLDWSLTSNLEDMIRVSYLTKEQIEAEGWKEISKYNYEKINSNITAYYGDDHYLWIMHPGKTILGEDYLANSFKGECKSINEFRYICKLLKI